MGQVLHGSARTTAAVRRAIQHSQESLRTLAKRHGINPKTVAKWRNRANTADQRPGPKDAHSTVLSIEEEAIIVAFRRHTLLPLDDCLYALQATIPHLTRSSLHRCLQRHDISRLPDVEGDKPKRSKFRSYPIGYFHIDIAEVRTEQGKLYMFVAIDRTSKFAFVELHEKARTATSRDFLLRLIEAVPYKIHTVLTDNGIQFTTPGGGGSAVPLIKQALANGERFWAHAFELACARNDIDHRTTKPKHPWTNGQVERMNRTIKEATVKRFYYETHDQLREHLANFVAAYNFAKRLKTLKGLTPYEFICKCWTKEPQRFTSNPHHQIPGPNTYAKGCAHMPPLVVTAFACDTFMSLTQTVAQEGGEAEAAIAALKLLSLKGLTVTADALHCHRRMTKAIRDGGGHYVIAIKGNQSKLAAEANAALDAAAARNRIKVHQTEGKAHGRHEVRRAFVVPFTQSPSKAALVDLVAVARVESWRAVSGKTTHKVRCYALSRMMTAEQLLASVRLHWAVENQLHWQLDVLLAEDLARSRKNNAPANLAILRRLALNVLRADPEKIPLSHKRLKARWADQDLLRLLTHMR
jgi:predicted transposase YbfD/YdcC/transposase-like protein